MKIYASDDAAHLVEADVVEAVETGTREHLQVVIGNDEHLLPSHEEMLLLGEVGKDEIGLLGRLRQRSPRAESRPVMQIDPVVAAPFGMAGVEGVSVANDLALEVGGQGRMGFGQA